tara:strand:+ start:834 stop:1598 length:765 start_codon:yes stop_codon:yes gene_type:complete
MLKVRIIPCLDVKNGRVVKGINFLNLIDAGDPVEQASFYSSNGADEICFLDIGASVENRKTMINVVEKTAEKVFIPLTVGGGVRTIKDIRALLKAGADKVSINTAGILNQKLISDSSKRFGKQCIVAAVDAKKTKKSWKVYSHGGTKETGLDAIEWMEQLQKLGAGEILLTSMDKDGTNEGFDYSLLKTASDRLNIPIIASGGAGKLSHFKEAVTEGNASALLAASVFHFAKFSIIEVKKYLKKENIKIRYLNE